MIRRERVLSYTLTSPPTSPVHGQQERATLQKEHFKESETEFMLIYKGHLSY